MTICEEALNHEHIEERRKNLAFIRENAPGDSVGDHLFTTTLLMQEQWLATVDALASREEELVAALPIIVFALGYFDFGDHGITWESCVKAWEENFKPALKAKHGGDCTNDCYSCARCQAEEVVRVSDMLRAALSSRGESE